MLTFNKGQYLDLFLWRQNCQLFKSYNLQKLKNPQEFYIFHQLLNT